MQVEASQVQANALHKVLGMCGPLLLVMAPLHSVATSQEPTSKEGKAVGELFQVLHHKDHLRKNGGWNFELFDKTQIQPVIEELERIASARIPASANEVQRAKLSLAAKLVIHRTIADIDAHYAQEKFDPMKFRPGTTMEIFGSGSLFEKVMRHQRLLDNYTSVLQ
ncbi:MAG: hypothetical protein SFV81_27170 [Pirellulaceae bacterium]|nr:hypothetical protein [Pirellulaceae bacterium]